MNAGRIIGRILFSVLGFACLFLGSISPAHASDYLGEFCFQSQRDGTIFRLAVTDMGDGHFLVNGKAIAVNGKFAPIHGNAEIGQEAILLTLNGGVLLSSNGTTITGTEMFTINYNLDLSSFNGNGEGIATQDNNGIISTFAITDTINFVACP